VSAFREIGLWAGPGAVDLPNVVDFVDEAQDPSELDEIASRLEAGVRTDRTYMGYSRCRFCDCQNGSGEQTDGTFIWPEGLSHYVREHHVRLPDQVTHHLRLVRDADPDEMNRAVTASNEERSREWWHSITMD
jgi:hypothetical protein